MKRRTSLVAILLFAASVACSPSAPVVPATPTRTLAAPPATVSPTLPPAPSTPTSVPPSATPPATATTPAPVSVPVDVDAANYIDDRSDGFRLMQSYVNGLNRREYLRSYSYWEDLSGVGSFADFEAGYFDTNSVELEVGLVGSDAGAGQLYYSVPAALRAHNANGETQTFVGCYVMHLSQPGIQTVPPFQGLRLRSADVHSVANDANVAALLASACPDANIQPGPTSTPADPADISPARYLDDRSDAASVLRSLFNAVNRHEYARAYAYWEPNSTVAPYPQFEAGYANTQSVTLETGSINGDAGAGQFYYTLPAVLRAQLTDGSPQTFVGCYTLHLSNPSVQGAPPFQPLGIRQALVQLVANDADTHALLASACANP